MTLRAAQKRWAQRRRQYVVGYIRSGNCVYWDQYSRRPIKQTSYSASSPMTLKEARALLIDMPSPGAAIFRLTPIEVGGGGR